MSNPTVNASAPKKLAAGSGGSVVVDRCQVCDAAPLEPILFVGYLPPVNTMVGIGSPLAEQSAYPAQLLRCPRCSLAQLGLIVDPAILFPPTYPYTSGTTKILRENFAELAREVADLYPLRPDDLLIDVGSNDGTLLGNFTSSCRVLGIEPTNASKLAQARGIDTIVSFFNREAATRALQQQGRAKVVAAANVFAHIENIHEVLRCVTDLLVDDGLFISESHYFPSLVETVQYDTIYHEHLRYYSVSSLQYLLKMHGLEVVHARPIPTHGGSARVYAARAGKYPVRESVGDMMEREAAALSADQLAQFRRKVTRSKTGLHEILNRVKAQGGRVYGIGAPSRASTLINYVGLDDSLLDCVLEIKGSYKIGKFMPGTIIPVLEESKLFEDHPEYALLLSWHIADELVGKIKARGYRGKFIVPLPEPHVID